MPLEMDTVLTVEDVARLLKVKPITVREMLREQRIRGFKVGKAWRTTETMLQEDLATIAKGAKPEPLEAQRVLAAQPRRVRKVRGAAPEKAAPAKRPAKMAKEMVKEVAKVAEDAPARPAKRAAKSSDKTDDQQLLF